MARIKAANGLEALRQQQIELARKIKEAEAKERDKQKADAERRERVAGRILLAHLAAYPDSLEAKVLRSLLGALIKPADRALFASIDFESVAAPVAGANTDDGLSPRAGVDAAEQPLSMPESLGG